VGISLSLKGLFGYFIKNDSEIHLIQKKLQDLEKQLYTLYEVENKEDKNTLQPPIIVEKIHIDRLHVDKFELSNNFGQLGIKELKGKLNIGANYGVGDPFPLEEEEKEETKSNKPITKPAKQEIKQTNEIKINIK
jgi:hypothetical protein